jgi:hypothetical protein
MSEIVESEEDKLKKQDIIEKEKQLHKQNFNDWLDKRCQNNVTKILNVEEGDRLLKILDGQQHAKNANEKFLIKTKKYVIHTQSNGIKVLGRNIKGVV